MLDPIGPWYGSPMHPRSRAAAILVLLASWSCNPLSSPKRLRADDCKARKLTRVDACTGEDSGSQEHR